MVRSQKAEFLSDKCALMDLFHSCRELLTRCAEPPYDNVETDQLIEVLESGYRLYAPDECPDRLYALLQRCWNANPMTRPTFAAIQTELVAVAQNPAGAAAILCLLVARTPFVLFPKRTPSLT